jgi:hypothetical protein
MRFKFLKYPLRLTLFLPIKGNIKKIKNQSLAVAKSENKKTNKF